MRRRLRLQWIKRAKRDDTQVARRRVWSDKSKSYRVTHSYILYGEWSLPDVFYADVFDPHLARWDILGRHRTKQAAMRHCEDHYNDTNHDF